jgi:hypothetical protein
LHAFPLFVRKTREKAGTIRGERGRILHGLKVSPELYSELLNANHSNAAFPSMLDDLWRAGLVIFSGFTATDALCVLGKMTLRDPAVALSKWGARVFAAKYAVCSSEEEFSRQVVELMNAKLAAFIARDTLERIGVSIEDDDGKSGIPPLLRCILGLNERNQWAPKLSMKINYPIVAVGTPIAAYSHLLENVLGADCLIPEFCGIASAIGAAVSTPWMIREVEITKSMENETFNLHVSDSLKIFESLNDAVHEGMREMTEIMKNDAAQIGIECPQIEVTRRDKAVEMSNGGSLYLGTTLIFEMKDVR